MSAEASVSVYIVDDHDIARRGISAYFESTGDFTILGEASLGRSCLAELQQLSATGGLPDVLLVDLKMPGMDGVALTAEVKSRFPDVKIVILTSFAGAERVRSALRAGASGYVLKDAEAAEIAAAVRTAARRGIHLDSKVMASALAPLKEGGRHDLTPREVAVLRLIATGCSNIEIAERLHINERTARTHVSNILSKLTVSSRTQAAIWAIKEGFVSVD